MRKLIRKLFLEYVSRSPGSYGGSGICDYYKISYGKLAIWLAGILVLIELIMRT